VIRHAGLCEEVYAIAERERPDQIKYAGRPAIENASK
jgi:hypothetical protein